MRKVECVEFKSGAILLEQSDKWITQPARTMTLETIGSVGDTPSVSLAAEAA